MTTVEMLRSLYEASNEADAALISATRKMLPALLAVADAARSVYQMAPSMGDGVGLGEALAALDRTLMP